VVASDDVRHLAAAKTSERHWPTGVPPLLVLNAEQPRGDQGYDRERWEHCERVRDREHELRDRLAYAPRYKRDGPGVTNRAVCSFFAWLEQHGIGGLVDIEPFGSSPT
jgi:hypothetical protein